jgi:hypothetical protein
MARERTVIGTLIALLLVLWLGFIFHRSPRFPGSVEGGILAVSGTSLLVLFSLAYAAVKRIPRLQESISKRVTLRNLLTWHVYTGALGAILVLLHTGHRFESNLGFALTTFMLLTTLSGYVGRHLMGRVAMEVREKQALLRSLETTYNAAVNELAGAPMPPVDNAMSTGFFHGLRIGLGWLAPVTSSDSQSPSRRAARVAESIAEVEYSLKTHERFKYLTGLWLKFHIVSALGFYVLLALHIWASIHFGLRWFQ